MTLLLTLVTIVGSTELDDALYEHLWSGAPAHSTTDIRGIWTILPLYGGNPIYENHWGKFAPNDRTLENVFHDHTFWYTLLAELKRLRFNSLLLGHPHPYPLFVDYSDTYPEAAWLTSSELKPKQEMLEWLIATAKEYGIDIYFLVWNIWTPPGYAEAHGISQEGVDTPETRAFTKWTIRKLFETYPDLGGLATMAGEAPTGCADFVREAIVGGMNDVEPLPRLLYWTWCSNPHQAKEVIDAFKGETWAMKYLQYEQFFARKADPRIGLYHQDLSGQTKMIALGGPKICHGGLLFAHPGFIYDVLHDLYETNSGRGLISESIMTNDRWLSRFAFARYLWDPTQQYNRDFWKDLVAERYGSPSLSGPLLELFEQASLVVPTQLKLTHSQSDHFMIQPGIMLTQIIAMPTLSTYIFENEQRLDERGYIKGNLGLSRPNPDWGEWIIPITQFVLEEVPDETKRALLLKEWIEEQHTLGFQPRPSQIGDKTPIEVVSELETIIAKAEQALEDTHATIHTAVQRTEELEHIVHLAEANIAMGRYYALKNKAAIAWERWRILGDETAGKDCQGLLKASLDAWYVYANHMDTLHDLISYWKSDLSIAPPWSQNDFWNSYNRAAGKVNERTPLWERELELVVQRIDETEAVPFNEVISPLADELIPLRTGIEIAHFDFEQEDERWRMNTNTCKVTLTDAPGAVINGRSLLADSRGASGRFHSYFETQPDILPLKPLTQYQVRLKYRVLERDDRSLMFIVLRSNIGGIPEADMGSGRVWSRPSGTQSTRVFDAVTGDFPDYHLVLGFDGKQCVVIDDIVVIEVRPEE